MPFHGYCAMANWFSKYINVAIFKEEGGPPSKRFLDHFTKGFVSYVGTLHKFTRMKYQEFSNDTYITFCQKFGYPIPSSHRMIDPNPEASYKSLAKYDKGPQFPDRKVWARTLEWTHDHFYSAMGGAEVLSKEKVLQAMDLNTSCGYPWSRKYTSKKDMLADEHMSRILDDYWEQLSRPLPPPTIWTCAQKVELRPIEKIEKNSHRTFLASPIEHSVALNRICLDMNEGFYESRHTFSFVGTSKFMGGWDQLYHHLSHFSEGNSLDAEQYDSSLFSDCLWGQCELRKRFLSTLTPNLSDVKAKLDTLYYDIINSYIVTETGELVQKTTGNPSGSACTIVDNTMILFRFISYAWITLAMENSFDASYESLMTHVRCKMNGDDIIFTVSPNVISWFDATNIARVLATIGVGITADNMETRSVSELDFLSNRFYYDPRLRSYLPCPSKEKVLSSLMYGSNIDDVRWHLLRAFALRLDSFGNPDLREHLRAYIDYILAEHRDQLVGHVCVNNTQYIPISDIMKSYKSDRFMEMLYTGYEGACNSKIPETPLKLSDAKLLYEAINFKPYSITFDTYHEQSLVMSGHKKHGKHNHKKVVEKNKLKKEHRHKAPKKKSFTSKLLSSGRKLASHLPFAGPAMAAADFVSTIAGHGSYSVNHNTIAKSSASIPEFSPGKDVRIRHKELICDIRSNADLFGTQYAGLINPTNSSMFPWLSGIASHFEQYKFEGLLFAFNSTSSDALNSTNTALGSVLMTTQYDAADAPFTDKQSMESYEFTTSCAPSCSAVHPVECKASADILKSRYVRNPYAVQNIGLQPDVALPNCVGSTNSVSLSAGSNITDVGLFQISTVGMQAISTIGELWVTYDIILSKPRLNPAGTSTRFAYYSNNPTGGGNLNASTGGNPVANVKLVQNMSTALPGQLGFPQLVPSTGSLAYIKFNGCRPGSTFKVHYRYYSPGGTVSIGGGNLAAVNMDVFPTFGVTAAGGGTSWLVGASTGTYENALTVSCQADNYTEPGYITIGNPTVLTSTAIAEIVIIEVPNPGYLPFSMSSYSEDEKLSNLFNRLMAAREGRDHNVADLPISDPPGCPPFCVPGGPDLTRICQAEPDSAPSTPYAEVIEEQKSHDALGESIHISRDTSRAALARAFDVLRRS